MLNHTKNEILTPSTLQVSFIILFSFYLILVVDSQIKPFTHHKHNLWFKLRVVIIFIYETNIQHIV